ncbi:hypothetical protein MLD38_015264 [Melastoma candidum]|uniref:Uncharacterized protein n=1 Tax=Melastoma candidum TaxID=119954 RepID=A0ACB9RIM5_9MYRT|nr:hypothetical protein MLD38_015264 [Melastoma candidum]
MGNPKQKWTKEEEEALRKGVAKHGTGKWKDIQRDPEFNKFLFSRSNIDLKDKWRNVTGGGSGQGQRDKSRAKTKALVEAAPSIQAPVPNASSVDEVMAEAAVDASAKVVDETKIVPRHDDDLISEALSNLNDPKGSEVGAIFNYIEKCHEVSQSFRRQLRTRLKRLVVLGKLEENQNRYKIKEETPLVAKTPAKFPGPQEHEDTRPRAPQTTGVAIFGETLDDAAIACAYRIAEAENKAFIAAEAVKEAERLAKMAEDTESIYQFTREILERCSGDEITLLA